MFDIAWSEFLVVAVVALVVVGPRDLPALLRNVGKMVATVRRMAGEFQTQFNDAMREAELDDLKKEVTGLKDAASKLSGPNPFQIARDELKNALQDVKPKTPAALAGAAAAQGADEVAADTPSAFAPPPPIEAPDEPPAPSEAEFAAIKPAADPRDHGEKADAAPAKTDDRAPPPSGAAA